MDPSETLEELRELVQEAFDYSSDPEYVANALAEKFNELDEWLGKGGALPDDWER